MVLLLSFVELSPDSPHILELWHTRKAPVFLEVQVLALRAVSSSALQWASDLAKPRLRFRFMLGACFQSLGPRVHGFTIWCLGLRV